MHISNLPKIPNLDIQLRHFEIDFFSWSSLPIQSEGGSLWSRIKISTNDKVRLVFRTLEFNLNVTGVGSIFDISIDLVGPTQDLQVCEWVFFANEEKRDRHTAGGKFNPRAIAQAMLLFPVPLGPMIMFR